MRRYSGVEIGRVVFACLIPILHMQLAGKMTPIIQQYFSRLGVPFFFGVSGLFLYQSLKKRGSREALRRYVSKVARLLLIWIAIYSPILLRSGQLTIQSLTFKTPAFLWYLTGLLVASIPFCLVQNRKVLHIVSGALFIVGTLFGDTYKWLLGGVPWYEELFITTRNGVFFGLPLMCVGELTWKKESASGIMLVISAILLALEITIVGAHAAPADDRSMYLMLPVFIFYLLVVLRQWNPKIDSNDFGGVSSAIYLMQFGVITVGNIVLRRLNIQAFWANWGIYLLVIMIPTLFYMLIKRTKLAKILF